MSFNKLHNYRKKFVKDNEKKDHIVVKGKNNILISAPHGVSQVRLGKFKFSEIGSLTTAIYLKQNSDCFFIAKTKNNNDDANFDETSSYKTSIEQLIKDNNIKYIIDIHGLSSKRNCDINLGTHLSNNIKTNMVLFDKLYNALIKNNYKTQIDQPFMAGNQTIAGSFANKFPHIWTIQIEINCNITNKIENFDKYKKLLNILIDWTNSIK